MHNLTFSDTISLQTKGGSRKQSLQGFHLLGDTPGAAFLPTQTLDYEVILVCSTGMSTAEGESLTGEMRFPSVPIFKSSLQVISFFLDASHSHIFCLFVLHERAHSLSPEPGLPFSIALIKCILFKWNVLRVSACHWPGCLQALYNHICRKHEGPKPSLWCRDLGLILGSGANPNWGPQPVPLCPLTQQLAEAESGGAKMQIGEEMVLFRCHSHQSCEGLLLTKQWMFSNPSNTWFGGYRREL